MSTQTMFKRTLLATAASISIISPAMAERVSLCASPETTRRVNEIVSEQIPSWYRNLMTDFGDWAKPERVINLTKVTAVDSVRTLNRDTETNLSTCVAKVTFSLDDHTMAPEIRYTVQPLEDKPDQIYVEVFSPYREKLASVPKQIATPVLPSPTPAAPPPAPAPVTTVIQMNAPAAPAAVLPPPTAEPQPAAATSPAIYAMVQGQSALYQRGFHDREAWESWYGGLPNGDYKSGAWYWAEQRSLQQPGSCYIGSVAFGAGCTAAKERLTPCDLLRKSEPEYKLGWNMIGRR